MTVTKMLWTIGALMVTFAYNARGIVLFQRLYPAPGSAASASTYIRAEAEATGGAALTSFCLRINGVPITNSLMSGAANFKFLTWQPDVPFTPNTTIAVTLCANDDSGFANETNYTFSVLADSTPPSFVSLSPATFTSDAKRISINVTAEDNIAMSNGVALLVNGSATAPARVTMVDNYLQCEWQSSLLPIGAEWPVQLTVWDVQGNAAVTQWLFHSTTTTADFRDLTFCNLTPTPAMGDAPPLATISARILTRLDRIISNIVLTVDGEPVTPFFLGNDDYDKTIVYAPAMPFAPGARIPVSLQASDGTEHQTSWWFEVVTMEDSGSQGVVLLNLWPRYAGPSQDLHIAWAQMRPGYAMLMCGAAVIYSNYHLSSDTIYTACIAASNRAEFGIPETGSNILTAMFTGETATQVHEYVHYLVPDMTVAQKGVKGYAGTPDLDSDSIWITYKSAAGDTPVINGRTIEVAGGPKAALAIRVRAVKGGAGDGQAEIERIVARDGLKQLALKGAGLAELFAPSGTIASLSIAGGNLGRSNVVAVAAGQVNGLMADSAASIRIQGGSIFGDILLRGVPNAKPPVISCSAKKNPLTKQLQGGTLFNASIRTEQCDIGSVGIRGGAGFVVEPSVYRQFRMYGTVMAGVATNYLPDGVYSNIAPAHVIRAVQLKNGRLMGAWITHRAAKHKISAYIPLREDVWYVDSEPKPQWNGR